MSLRECLVERLSYSAIVFRFLNINYAVAWSWYLFVTGRKLICESNAEDLTEVVTVLDGLGKGPSFDTFEPFSLLN